MINPENDSKKKYTYKQIVFPYDQVSYSQILKDIQQKGTFKKDQTITANDNINYFLLRESHDGKVLVVEYLLNKNHPKKSNVTEKWYLYYRSSDNTWTTKKIPDQTTLTKDDSQKAITSLLAFLEKKFDLKGKNILLPSKEVLSFYNIKTSLDKKNDYVNITSKLQADPKEFIWSALSFQTKEEKPQINSNQESKQTMTSPKKNENDEVYDMNENYGDDDTVDGYDVELDLSSPRSSRT